MAHIPLPAPVQLDPPGPYVVPTVEGSVGLGLDQDTGQSQLRLALQGGTELRIPLTNAAYQRLKDLFAKAPDAPEYDQEG